MDPVTEHAEIEEHIERVKRVAAKHPHYVDVCTELRTQITRMNAYNGVLKTVTRNSSEYHRAFDKFKYASWEVMILNETKRAMEASLHAELQDQ